MASGPLDATERSDAKGAREPRFPLVFVAGVGHSGSTLFGRLLNGHPACAFVGETARVVDVGRETCSCGVALGECPTWRPLLPALDGRRRDDQRALTPELYEAIRRRFGARVLVDSSKTVAWRIQRRPWSAWRRVQVGYVVVVRDSRGVMASAHRAGKAVPAMLARHLKWIRRWERFVERAGERATIVFYEDLCEDPRRELARVCDFLGLPFDESMLRPADHEHHYVHANPLRYLGRGNAIRLDERWRDELPSELRARVEATMRRSRLLRTRYLEPTPASRGG